MTSNRSYRKALSQDVVRRQIEENAGTQFDPDMAKIMLGLIDNDTEYVMHEMQEKTVGTDKFNTNKDSILHISMT